ncbi:immunity 49 family protein [Spirillospora sp. NPDC052269]
MHVDRHDFSEASVSSALAAVPNELDGDTSRAQYGGPMGIEMLAGMLLDYAAARTAEIDPRVETRETWLALSSAAQLYRDYARAQTVPVGGEVRAWVEYLGVGFGFAQEDEETLSATDWVQAFRVAVAVGDDGILGGLYGLVEAVPEEAGENPFMRALRVFWNEGPAEDYPDTLEGSMLRAIAGGDAAAFNAALVTALEQHRERAGSRARDLIAWEPLALASLAHEAGLPVEVESGYLPVRMITRAGPKKPGADGLVSRPEFGTDRAAQWLEAYDEIERNPVESAFSPECLVHYRFEAMGDVARYELMALTFHSVVDPGAEDPRYAKTLALASEAYAAAFRLASVPRGTPITVTLGGRTDELPASGPVSEANDSTYARAVALAWTVRSQADLAILTAFDSTDLRPTLQDTTSYARACHAVLRGEDPRPILKKALAKTSGDDWWECLSNPRLRLLDRIVEDDADGFNTVLAEALGLYADYYGAGDRLGAPAGQLNFEALGLACLAHDRGIQVRVESGFLPRAVIEGLSRR